MKAPDSTRPTTPARSNRSPLLLAGACFILGAALTAFWLHRPPPASAPGKSGIELSAATKNVLGGLVVPVTIHYFSLLPTDSTEAGLPDFAGRVADLLNVMQNASAGKLTVTTLDTPAETNANAASTAGIQPFNLEKGQACFLGLTLASGKHQETFARLQPEWEPALEFDLARAIARVAIPEPPAPVAPEVAKPSPEIVSSINRLIPDVNTTSEETADQIFHAEFMKELADAGTEMDNQMTAAQQQVTSAQASGSATDLEAAQKNLAQVQLAQSAKIREIAANLKTRQAVFQSLKNAAAK